MLHFLKLLAISIAATTGLTVAAVLTFLITKYCVGDHIIGAPGGIIDVSEPPVLLTYLVLLVALVIKHKLTVKL